jgi:hypothetical protein
MRTEDIARHGRCHLAAPQVGRHGPDGSSARATISHDPRDLKHEQGARGPAHERPQGHEGEKLALNPAHAAQVVGLSTKTLANVRIKGGVPVFVPFGHGKGSRIAYRLADIGRWLIENRRTATSATQVTEGGAR